MGSVGSLIVLRKFKMHTAAVHITKKAVTALYTNHISLSVTYGFPDTGEVVGMRGIIRRKYAMKNRSNTSQSRIYIMLKGISHPCTFKYFS